MSVTLTPKFIGQQGKSKNTQATGDKKDPTDQSLMVMNPNAAGIDIGSRSHFVSVSPDTTVDHVKEFGGVTEELLEMAEWLKECGVTTIAMESTGVYWIPVFRILEKEGFDVRLIDARRLKNVPGRKTDVEDCQWIRRLHMFGLLEHAFVPPQLTQNLRVLVRHRASLIDESSRYILRMQKALEQMNLKLRTVISDIVGKTGTQIIEAIIAGNHDPEQLAKFRDGRCKANLKQIEQALTGNFRRDVLYTLESAYETYKFFMLQKTQCDSKIEQALKTMIPADQKLKPMPSSGKTRQSKRAMGNAPDFDLEGHLYELTGVNLVAIPGVNAVTALKVISQCGSDMSQWKSAKHFASWLSLCPGNKISGGKSMSGRTRKSSNPAAAALRMAAESLERGTSFLSVFFRRIKARKGGAKAVTAAAHKLAVIIYEMLKNKVPFKELGADWYDKNYAERTIKKCKKMLEALGQKLVLEPIEKHA